MNSALTIDDLKKLARRRVPRMFFDYADSGSFTEQTYRTNSADFQKIYLKQRIARKLNDLSLASQMVGLDVAMPMALAPTGLTGMQHADGEMHAAVAAEKAGVPFTLSTMSVCSIEDVKSVTTKPFWFQVYVMRDKTFMRNLIDRARDAGCSALVVTMDLQLLAQRHKDLRNGLSTPPRFTPHHIWQMATRPMWCLGMLGTNRHSFRNIVGHAPNVSNLRSLSAWTAEQFDPELNWDEVKWIRDYWGGKIIIKGIMEPEDAKLAAATGADAIIVSNHGGRQLDGAWSSIRMLPQIVEAVGDKIEVHMDGGIRTGVDIARALALGAKGVYVGRPFLYGLGAGGEAGVTKSINILRKELEITMALCGERDVRKLGAHNIQSIEF
ncbi:MAG: alpha-hydroxy-acid oxidizing protein [Hyphomicrobiaceae bacterium]|nr:alpha-hydroxy-acid oxidizing protein [Hyphomicrobiaceae bacterium]